MLTIYILRSFEANTYTQGMDEFKSWPEKDSAVGAAAASKRPGRLRCRFYSNAPVAMRCDSGPFNYSILKCILGIVIGKGHV